MIRNRQVIWIQHVSIQPQQHGCSTHLFCSHHPNLHIGSYQALFSAYVLCVSVCPYNHWICLWMQNICQNFYTGSTLPMQICAVPQLQTVLIVRTFEGTENLRVQNAGSLLCVHQLLHHPILYSIILLFQSQNCR